MQLSFNFLESSAIFTDLSLFTVMTTGDTDNLRLRLLRFLGVRILLVFLVHVRRLFKDVMVSALLLFVSPNYVQVLIGC